MLKSFARFSKQVAKYSYYPMLIGFIALGAAIAYDGPQAFLGWTVAAICAVFSLIALLSSKICKKAGIDDRII